MGLTVKLMKTLYLVRHADSGWDNANRGDFERTLSKKGLKEAARMATRLRKDRIAPDLLVSSPAFRALTTAEIFADTLDVPAGHIVKRLDIYEGSTGTLIDIIQALPDNCSTVMLFGHNPAITSAVHLLSGSNVGKIETCGIAQLEFKGESWQHVQPGNGKLTEVMEPE